MEDISFGPVPSRRLGRSLGINHIPLKVCSYSCVYCQVGPTPRTQATPRPFYPPAEVARLVGERVERLRAAGEPTDYLTFVPDGEPTLDGGLGREIDLLRPLGIPIAVISNASLVWRPEVARALSTTDWVSLKVDTVDRAIWRRLNRPHRALRLPVVLEGIRQFSAAYVGELAAETMLVAGVNDAEEQVEAVAAFLAEAGIGTAYLAVPLRPPAVLGARPPEGAVVARAHQILSRRLNRVELLTAPEVDTFASSGEARRELLRICAVHPMREGAVRALLEKEGTPWSTVEDLVAGGMLREIEYRGDRFYLRGPGAVAGADAPRGAPDHQA